MQTETRRLLELVRLANAGCSDYRLAQIMGVTRSTISLWVHGKGHMSPANVTKACALSGYRDVGREQMFIAAEREKGPDGAFYREFKDDLLKVERGEEPSEHGWVRQIIEGVGKHAAALIFALVAGFSGFAPSPAHAAGPSVSQGMYIMLRRYRSRRLFPQAS